MTEEGVEFRSPVDGATHFLSPERAIEIQHALGADIIHPLDECLAYPATREDDRALARRSPCAGRARSLAAHRAPRAARQALFGIVQGGILPGSARAGGGARPSRSASTATRSAAWRWASRSR